MKGENNQENFHFWGVDLSHFVHVSDVVSPVISKHARSNSQRAGLFGTFVEFTTFTMTIIFRPNARFNCQRTVPPLGVHWCGNFLYRRLIFLIGGFRRRQDR